MLCAVRRRPRAHRAGGNPGTSRPFAEAFGAIGGRRNRAEFLIAQNRYRGNGHATPSECATIPQEKIF